MIVTLSISKTTIAKTMESLVYKYANAIDNEGNPKGVRNLKSDRIADTVDAFIVNGRIEKRINEVLSIAREFVNSVTGTDPLSINLNMPDRWNGQQASLQSFVEQYILDGLMADWLSATAPSEAPMYANLLPKDTENIIAELYTKGAPS